MAAGPERDLHAVRAQEIPRAHDVIDRRDLEVDVLHPRLIGWKHGDLVVHGIDPQQRGIADAIADPRVEHLGPERLIALRVGGIQADMTELGNPGVAAGEIAPARMVRPDYEVDAVAARIIEVDECPDAPVGAFLVAAAMHFKPTLAQITGRRRERHVRAQLEADAELRRAAIRETQSIIAIVAAQPRHARFARDELQTDDLPRK